MDTTDTGSRRIRVNLFPLTVLFLVGVVLTFGFAASTAQMPEQGKKKEVFFDDDLKEGRVPGVWQVVTEFDRSQLDDPAAPVVVDAIMTFGGKGKYVGLVKIAEVGIKNRGAKAVRSLQLRWTFAPFNEPDVALLEGYTPFFDARIEADASRDVEIPAIFFNREIKRLTKGGSCTGISTCGWACRRPASTTAHSGDGRNPPPTWSRLSITVDASPRPAYKSAVGGLTLRLNSPILDGLGQAHNLS